ncbi:unnamed protein product, partial [Trichobilharzia regenti]
HIAVDFQIRRLYAHLGLHSPNNGTNYKRPDVEAEIRAARSNGINNSNKWETPLTPLSSPPLSLSPIVHISNNQLHCNSIQHTNNHNDSNNNNNTNNYSHHNQVQPQDSSTKYVSPSSPSAPTSTVQQTTKENLGFKALCLYDYVASKFIVRFTFVLFVLNMSSNTQFCEKLLHRMTSTPLHNVI